MTTTEDVIKSAAAVARHTAEGRLRPEELDAAVAEVCKTLFGTVVGTEDPLFGLQVDVTRQVLAAGGIALTELQEWVSVLKRRGEGTTTPDEPVSFASVDYSPDSGDPGGESEADL
ncbi:flagellar hook-length control protein [Mycolicibacterium sp. XJ2546]